MPSWPKFLPDAPWTQTPPLHYHPLVLGKRPLRWSESPSTCSQRLWRLSGQSWSHRRPVEGSDQFSRQRDTSWKCRETSCRHREALLTSWVKVSEEVVGPLRNSLVSVFVIMYVLWASATSMAFSSGVKNTRYLTLRPASPASLCNIEICSLKIKNFKNKKNLGQCQTFVPRPIVDPGMDCWGMA